MQPDENLKPRTRRYLGGSLSIALDFRRITRKWNPLRGFAGRVVESALESIRGGQIHIAQYFAKLLYFLPFTPASLEKVLLYSLAKASKGFVEKNPSLYEVKALEVPGFEPDEVDKVGDAFQALSKLGIAELVAFDKIKLRPEVIDKLIEPIAFYLAKQINLRDIEPDTAAYPYKVTSGLSSLYVMHRVGRLPSSFTIMAGLLSPVAWIRRDGKVERKTTIDRVDWTIARDNMSKLRPLRDRFEVEYFKAVGFLYENNIIIRTYPSIEIPGSLVDAVIVPAYREYYRSRIRPVQRVRK
ncbi:MAG: hypothetical protein LM564_01515 [Desulfurococcaceae archaeon]|nr:hypothetical protein [Desulfurococcaceae archaeon]